MSIRQWLASLFTADSGRDEADELRRLFNEREQTVDLVATFSDPYPNTVGQPTVVFPIELETTDGQFYGTTSIEHPIPDNGTDDTDSPLVNSVSDFTGVEPSDVTIETVFDIEGTSVRAELNETGGITFDTE